MLTGRGDVWLCAVCALAMCAGRAEAAGGRPRGRPVADEELQYRGSEAAEAGGGVVLVSDDPYRLYRARADRYDDDEDYRPRAPLAPRKETPKAPPVQTIRNYNKVNDDGSFTFGYEAADGSFKEETRGTDCVVRGKYGYVDPDGNKREFTYVSGNPCDPNRPDEDEPEAPESAEDDGGGAPANYPVQAPRRPAPARPPTAYFQNDFRDDEEEEEPLQHIRQRVVQRPRPAPAPAHLAITPRPQPVSTPRALPPPTTFRPQLLAVPVPTPTQAPRFEFSPSPSAAPQPPPSPRPAHATIDFAAEFAKFQRENSPTSDGHRPASASPPLYSTQLVLDPASGQYDTQLFQALPQTKGELNLNQRLQSFVPQPSPRPFQPSQQLYRAPAPAASPAPLAGQQLYQRQQAEAQFANSAQLFQQQQQLQHSQLQRDRAAARLQAQRLAAAAPARPHAQPAQQPQLQYYVQQPSSGHIDSFLRQHAIQF